jgi:hypothetical protein
MWMPDFFCLEGGIQVLDADDSFGAFSLKERKDSLYDDISSCMTSSHLHQALYANQEAICNFGR